MYYVYLIKSLNFPHRNYVGFTEDLHARLAEHNAGESVYTDFYKPWELITYCAFKDKYRALSFEKYLKSGSGHVFDNKRLW